MTIFKLEDKGFIILGKKPDKVFSFWFTLLFWFGVALNGVNLYWACLQNNPIRGFFAYACLGLLLIVKVKVDKVNSRASIYNFLSREYDVYEVSK